MEVFLKCTASGVVITTYAGRRQILWVVAHGASDGSRTHSQLGTLGPYQLDMGSARPNTV